MSNMNLRKFSFSTISSSLLDKVEGVPVKIRLFNFSERTKNISLDKAKHGKDLIGAFEATWIRIYNDKNIYYDFITASVFFITNKTGVVLMCSEDTQLLDSAFFAKEVTNFIIKHKEKGLSNLQYLDKYISEAGSELKEAYKELSKHYSLQKQFELGRLNIDDLFVKTKNELTIKYLKDLILKKVMKENQDDIVNLLESA